MIEPQETASVLVLTLVSILVISVLIVSLGTIIVSEVRSTSIEKRNMILAYTAEAGSEFSIGYLSDKLSRTRYDQYMPNLGIPGSGPIPGPPIPGPPIPRPPTPSPPGQSSRKGYFSKIPSSRIGGLEAELKTEINHELRVIESDLRAELEVDDLDLELLDLKILDSSNEYQKEIEVKIKSTLYNQEQIIKRRDTFKDVNRILNDKAAVGVANGRTINYHSADNIEDIKYNFNFELLPEINQAEFEDEGIRVIDTNNSPHQVDISDQVLNNETIFVNGNATINWYRHWVNRTGTAIIVDGRLIMDVRNGANIAESFIYATEGIQITLSNNNDFNFTGTILSQGDINFISGGRSRGTYNIESYTGFSNPKGVNMLALPVNYRRSRRETVSWQN